MEDMHARQLVAPVLPGVSIRRICFGRISLYVTRGKRACYYQRGGFLRGRAKNQQDEWFLFRRGEATCAGYNFPDLIKKDAPLLINAGTHAEESTSSEWMKAEYINASPGRPSTFG